MMFHYPYFGYPYTNRYSRYGYQYPNYSSRPMYPMTPLQKKTPTPKQETKKEEPPTDSSEDRSSHPNDTQDAPIFEIFGIKLYFDDILLVCLIFFLYQEGVKDESLFISLILLLLS